MGSPGAAMIIAELAKEAGVPDGVINIVSFFVEKGMFRSKFNVLRFTELRQRLTSCLTNPESKLYLLLEAIALESIYTPVERQTASVCKQI